MVAQTYSTGIHYTERTSPKAVALFSAIVSGVAYFTRIFDIFRLKRILKTSIRVFTNTDVTLFSEEQIRHNLKVISDDFTYFKHLLRRYESDVTFEHKNLYKLLNEYVDVIENHITDLEIQADSFTDYDTTEFLLQDTNRTFLLKSKEQAENELFIRNRCSKPA